MSEASIPAVRPPDATGHWTGLLRRSQWLSPALAILLVALVRSFSPTGVDQSVLMTWTERLFDGGRPYVDFVEINPPGSIMLYVPAVLLGRASGLSSEVIVVVLMCGLIALSLYLSGLILRDARTLDAHDRPTLLAVTVLILGAMPAVAFAQREHVGIVALLPLLSIAAAAIANSRPAFWLRGLAGLLAGLAMVAKPHFALLIAGIMIHTALATRRLRPMIEVQWITAAAVVAAYFAYTYWAYPEFYSTALPRIADVYLGWRLGMDRMAINPVLPIVAISAILLRRVHAVRPLSQATLLLATTCLLAVAVFFIQGRGWPYHALPALTAAALGLGFEATRRKSELPMPLQSNMLMATAAITLVAYAWCFKDHDRNLDEISSLVTQTHARPGIIAIAEDISVGHPLVRRVEGRWAHRFTHLWTAGGVIRQLNANTPPSAERSARLLAHLATEIDELAQSMHRERPDIILAQTGFSERREFNWLEWAQNQPQLARELENYDTAGRIGDIEILKRKN